MKVYVRKIDEQCITHQISFRNIVWKEFFNEATEFTAVGVTSGYSETVKVLPNTDLRFDAGLSHVIAREGELEVGDILVIYKDTNKYDVELVKPNNSKYNYVKELCERDERHTLLEIESGSLNDDNKKEKFKNWLLEQRDLSEVTVGNYVRYIDYIKEKGYTNYDLYSVSDISVVVDLINKFKTDERYIEYNNQNNRAPLAALSKYEIFLNSTNDNLKSSRKDLRSFYIENLKNNYHVENQIESRKRFVEEYPLERLLELTKEEYCLGLDNQDALCYKLEFGEYKQTGFGIGGGTAGKYGMYYSSDDNVYKGKNNKIIADPDEYWNKYKRQLYDFLKEMESSEPNFVLDEKYPLLGGSGNYMFLTKLLCLYYPDRFVSSSNGATYDKLAKYLNVKLGNKAISNSYYANIYFRQYVPESNDNDSYYISNAIWKYFHNDEETSVEDNGETVIGAFNKIYYGVPGSGKSYSVNKIFNDEDFKVIRTTFHPEYTNADFIGQIIPKLHRLDNGKSVVSYDFNEGAFTKALKYALSHSSEKVVLIIEEINRGNASAIFGDIFQLLDRDENGNSKYAINNETIIDYLNSDKEYDFSLEKIIIPSNLWIIGTMNTSDQNVFTLDTAFKRRWKMEYIPNVFETDDEYSKSLREAKIPKTDISWEQFVTEINGKIANDDNTINSEDKQLGMYFVTLEEVQNEKEFAEKVLSYLWDDVAKINPEDWFGNIKTYDELLSSYEKESVRVFNKLFENYQIHIEENNDEQSDEQDTI